MTHTKGAGAVQNTQDNYCDAGSLLLPYRKLKHITGVVNYYYIIEGEAQEQFYRYHKIYALTNICMVTGTQESACQMLTCSWDRTFEDALPEQPSVF